MNIIQNYIDGLKQKIIHQLKLIREASVAVEKSKKNLRVKTQEKKTVTKLIDLRREAYIKSQNKKLNNELSEIYIMSAARKDKWI